MYYYTQEDENILRAEYAAAREVEEYMETNAQLTKQLEMANAEIDKLKTKRREKDRKSQSYKLGRIEAAKEFADKLKLAFFCDEEIVNRAWVKATYLTNKILEEIEKGGECDG